ncbi:hypothetical protein HDU91_003990 [Kappamyces sp. JEL0680]|nr:hypothetical protein HDU91_003990 [Kappamyces sp. JEL0680]
MQPSRVSSDDLEVHSLFPSPGPSEMVSPVSPHAPYFQPFAESQPAFYSSLQIYPSPSLDFGSWPARVVSPMLDSPIYSTMPEPQYAYLNLPHHSTVQDQIDNLFSF